MFLFGLRWTPQRQFLYNFVTHSRPKLALMSASQLSGVLWAFARLASRLIPVTLQLEALVIIIYVLSSSAVLFVIIPP